MDSKHWKADETHVKLLKNMETSMKTKEQMMQTQGKRKPRAKVRKPKAKPPDQRKKTRIKWAFQRNSKALPKS